MSKHGERLRDAKRPAEYISWVQMRQRCLNPNHHAYQRYGGRGITVCQEWNDYAVFLRDMGRKPSRLHSLDRRDNDRSYSAANCRWATKKEQGRNRADNKLLEFGGKKQSVAAWADELHISRNAIYLRLANGWSVERALTR